MNFDRGDKFRDGRDQLASTDDRPVVSSSVQVSRVVQEKVGLCRCKRHQLMNYQLDRVVDISRFKAARCMPLFFSTTTNTVYIPNKFSSFTFSKTRRKITHLFHSLEKF